MARNRSGQDLINDAYDRADNESATDRHSRTEVLRYVNEGCCELYDLLIEARGRTYYRSATPWTITTTASTHLYTSSFPAAFYKLVGVRMSAPYVEALQPLQPQEEAYYADTNITGTYPTHYDLRPTGVALFPYHDAGLTVIVDYVPAFTDLTDSSGSNFDGINGWEEYVVSFAARCMAIKDEEWELVAACERDMARMKERIAKLAPKRDGFRARRVNDVRGARMWGWGWRVR